MLLIATFVFRFVLFAQVGLAPLLQASNANAQSTTAPSSQPTQTTIVVAPSEPNSLGDALSNTRLFRLLQNKDQRLELKDVLQPAFWFDTIRELIVTLIAFIPRFVVALLFLLFFWIIYRTARKVVVGSMSKARVDNSIRDMMGVLLKWAIMGFGIVIACNQLGIQITALLTGVSIIGLAIGFAAQETLANFIAGVVIFWDKPFKVGEWITIDDSFSQVKRVTFRSTRLLTLDGQTLVFPNTYMLANKVQNHSTHPINRVNIPIGIAYSESIDDARATLLSLTTGDKRLVNDPPPQVVVSACADSSVNLVLRFWVSDESQEKAIYYEYLEKAKKAFDAAGIEIPFPHVQLIMPPGQPTNGSATVGSAPGAVSASETIASR
ncbi:MAG: mechanosensitive ion channel family protein [Phycisphaerae bacterium]|nr:mechanosensitive ion channel family protein [Phycisphaerae bacterium]